MNRLEALHILGLGEEATPEEINIAYKETAQILHPDKFANNKKLQERATEQFKNLQEAYAYLSSGKGAKSSSKAPAGRSSAAYEGSRANIEARLAGITAARAQLVAQRDEAEDERRNGFIMAGLGAVVALITIRRPFGLFGLLATASSAAVVWGIVQVVSSGKKIDTLNAHLRKLNQEKKQLLAALDEM